MQRGHLSPSGGVGYEAAYSDPGQPTCSGTDIHGQTCAPVGSVCSIFAAPPIGKPPCYSNPIWLICACQ
jgi:hypothetical protein